MSEAQPCGYNPQRERSHIRVVKKKKEKKEEEEALHQQLKEFCPPHPIWELQHIVVTPAPLDSERVSEDRQKVNTTSQAELCWQFTDERKSREFWYLKKWFFGGKWFGGRHTGMWRRRNVENASVEKVFEILWHTYLCWGCCCWMLFVCWWQQLSMWTIWK